jgi:hypothetical protein
VTNISDTSVSWSVNAIFGGNSIVGIISADGTYTAPAESPSLVGVKVTAASHANVAKSGNTSVTIVSDITMTLTPGSAIVELGVTQGFRATVNSAGHPDSAVRWSTALNTNPVTILIQDQAVAGALNEIEHVIMESLAVWTGVPGMTLAAAAPARVTRVAANACGSDGVNSICFDQADMAFAPGMLAFTRVITAERIGVQVGSGALSTQVGQILDADIYLNPSDSRINFATPLALATAPNAYALESVLTHELGHFFGF